MNIPNAYRKAVDGFIIPPRTFWQMAVSAAEGTFSLFEQSNRAEFIENLDKGTINESVISQATAGPFIMLSLFNDLQSPHFKEIQFNPKDFLDGVGGALANFHNVTGALENQLHKMVAELKEGDGDDDDDDDDDKKKDEENGEENKLEDSAVAALKSLGIQPLGIHTSQGKGFEKILEHTWLADAKNDSDSLAGQLSRMTTKELFQIHEHSLKFHSLLQKDHSGGIKFKEGSCSVNNVALLSARAFLCREIMKEEDSTKDEDEIFDSISGPRYETVHEVDEDGESSDKNGLGVAAQMEVLYDITQEFIQKKPLASSSSSTAAADDNQGDKSETASSNNNDGTADEIVQTTMVSVATLEGWLTGGPDGELRWKLALYRPAFEFPGFQQSY